MIASLILAATLFAQPAHERGWSPSILAALVETEAEFRALYTFPAVFIPARRLRIGWERKTGHTEALDRRLASVQDRIDRTMDADEVKRLNAEYARLQRELDKRDMAKVKANTREMERLLK